MEYRVSEIGLPEIDRIRQAWKFGTEMKTTSLLTRAALPPKNAEDGISKLPNEVLQFIISRLPMRESAATIILSKRWRNLWRTSALILKCDAANVLGPNYYLDTPSSHQINHRLDFVRLVNQVLRLHPNSKIEALRVAFDFDTESASEINQWIKIAINHQVREIQLDFDCNYIDYWGDYPSYRSFDFPFQSLVGASCLHHLHLDSCVFDFPPDFKGFNSLTSLTLKHVGLSQGSVQNIFTNCPVLQWLGLLECEYIGSFTKLNVSGLSLQLKHMCIATEKDHIIPKIEVHDVYIMSLEFTGFFERLTIDNAPFLETLVLYTETPVALSNVPRLQTLFLTTYARTERSIVYNINVFNNLKRLVFFFRGRRTNLLQVFSILKACPMLQKFELGMGFSDKPDNALVEKIATRPRIPEVEVYGVRYKKLELMKRFLENVITPEKMKLFTTTKTYLGDGKWILKEELQGKRKCKQKHGNVINDGL